MARVRDRIVLFAGIVAGALLVGSMAAPTSAQQVVRLFGTLQGTPATPQAVAVTAAGALVATVTGAITPSSVDLGGGVELSQADGFLVLTTGGLQAPATSPTPAVSDTSTDSCGTTDPAIAGNNAAGTVTVGETGGTSCTITFTEPAPVRWICVVNNASAAELARSEPQSTTATNFVGTFGAGDELDYICIAH